MEFIKTDIDGCYLINYKAFYDDRGYFSVPYNSEVFNNGIGYEVNFIQDNMSYSFKNVIRGLHFQRGEYEQAKLVTCTYGDVLDVAVDIRKDSPILLSLVYKNYYNNSETYPAKLYGKEFDDMVLSIFKQYDNLNIVLKRNTEGEHNDAERYQGLTESIELDNLIKYSLDTHNIPYIEVMVDDNTVNNIMAILDISKSLESTYQ